MEAVHADISERSQAYQKQWKGKAAVPSLQPARMTPTTGGAVFQAFLSLAETMHPKLGLVRHTHTNKHTHTHTHAHTHPRVRTMSRSCVRQTRRPPALSSHAMVLVSRT